MTVHFVFFRSVACLDQCVILSRECERCVGAVLSNALKVLMFRRDPSPRSRGLVLAVGSHVCRLGKSGTGIPGATIPASDLPLIPAGAAASALAHAACSHLNLSIEDVRGLILVVVEPASNFGREERSSLARSSVHLLGMPHVLFLPFHLAVTLAADVDFASHLIVDVGWKSSRVIAQGDVVSVANVGLKDIDASLNHDMPLKHLRTDISDLRSRACYFLQRSLRSAEIMQNCGNLVDDAGNVVVPSELRFSAPDALFGDITCTCPRLDEKFQMR